MRRIAILLSWCASCALALTPVAMPHAHIHEGHGDVFVHGGHDHAFGGRVEFHADEHHDDEHHDDENDRHGALEDHEDPQHPLPQINAPADSADLSDFDRSNLVPATGVSTHLAHAHVVQLGGEAIDPPAKPPPKCIPLKLVTSQSVSPTTRCSRLILASHILPDSRRALLPPSRGPPALILKAA